MSLSDDPASDDALIAQIKQGDAESLALFIDQNRSSLLRFLRTISSDRLLGVVELDDLMQEVSTAAITQCSGFPFGRRRRDVA